MKPFQRHRIPIYVGGFLLGTAAVMLVSQVKRATAPDFAEVRVEPRAVELKPGGSFRLRLGPEPGRQLAWGFPTQLMVGFEEQPGRFAPALRMEYRDLVEAETLVGPFDKAGRYELRAQFFACDHPGEKYCAKIALHQPFNVGAGPAASAELPLVLDVAAVARHAAENGHERELRLREHQQQGDQPPAGKP